MTAQLMVGVPVTSELKSELTRKAKQSQMTVAAYVRKLVAKDLKGELPEEILDPFEIDFKNRLDMRIVLYGQDAITWREACFKKDQKFNQELRVAVLNHLNTLKR